MIAVDSWIYLAALRLHDLGYLPTMYTGMRPYTRVSLAHMLTLSQRDILQDQDLYGSHDEVVALFDRLHRELAPELAHENGKDIVVESTYARVRGVSGTPLNDSFHLGQTFVNDYGRPFQEGVNGITGASGYITRGRFTLQARGEYQHAPSALGYNSAAVQALTGVDNLTPGIPHDIIPQGTIAGADRFRLLNAAVSAHVLGHEIGFGKLDEWLGPASGGAMAWSNNAEPIYAFHINRIEPLYIPWLSNVTGPFRYEFFVGSLKGHDTPNSPWTHMEKVSFKPSQDLEFGFARTVIWGGKDHAPITLGTFFRSFFSVAAVQPNVKFSRDDPGARFSTFDVSYRIPWKSHLFTVYADSFVHDNVFPVSNPGRAAIRPGILITRLPHLSHVDLRAEGAFTDVNDPGSAGGGFLFYEAVQRNGYTNRNFLLGDAIGRENKGGNAWITWHTRPGEQVQLEFRTVKAAKDFIPGGTTQQTFGINAVLRPVKNMELRTSLQGELWRAPLVQPGLQHSVSATVQLTYFPGRLKR